MKKLLLLGALATTLTLTMPSPTQAQTSHHVQSSQHSRQPISHHGYDGEKHDDEFRMSHLDGDAGDLIGLVLPDRVIQMPHTAGRWEAAEKEMIAFDERTETSATIRLLHSGTTVVHYKYKYNDGGKEAVGSYPFTIRIHRVEPEMITMPSTLYVGWEQSIDLGKEVNLRPRYSEALLDYRLENPTIADIRLTDYGPRLYGRILGETMLYVTDQNGLQTEARVVVQVPELTGIDIVNMTKTMAPGETQQLQTRLTPLRAQPEVHFSSEDPKVATVTADGLVTAHSVGKTKITVITDNGKKDSVTLKVK